MKSSRSEGLLHHGIRLGVGVMFVLPLIWVFTASLRQPGLPPPRTIEWWPDPVTWRNYIDIFRIAPLGVYLANSLMVVFIALPTTLLTASWAGFALAQLSARWRRWGVSVSVAIFLIPAAALWLTRFIFFTWTRLIDSWGALLAPALMGSSPLFVLIFYWAFRRIPTETYESAQLDGANALAIWEHIALPLARPAVVVVSVLTFLMYWNDYLNPLLYLRSPNLYTLPVGLQQLQQLDHNNWPILLAACVLLAVPAVILVWLAQRALNFKND